MYPARRAKLVILWAQAALVMIGLAGCATAPRHDWIAHGRHAMVATDHPAASRAGVRVLQEGGNAIDAAIAVSFALSVTRPQSTGLGGGGFLILRAAQTGEITVLDYRETAPAAASADMYDRAVASAPDRAPPSQCGHLAVAVPGQLAGLAAMHERLGERPLADLIAPAIALAENGFAVDAHYVDATRSALELYQKHPELRESCAYVYRVHLQNGQLRKKGDELRQPELARLLRAIAKDGPDVFYRGPVADAIDREMKRHGGLVTAADLAAYEVAYRAPLISTYRDYEIVAMPPPSSGGTCIIEALNILENVDLPAIGVTNRPLATHYIVEAMKHAFADRARWQGDADFVPVPTELLTSKVYARQLAAALDPNAAAEPDTAGALQIPDDAGTSHFCIVDRWGNCVVSTETINTSFGSLAAVDEWGLILNNEMDDFTARSDQANAFNLTQSARNAVEPRKRPLSSMSPTLVLKDGQPVALLGGSGGPRIISSVLNVLLGLIDFGMPLDEAMLANRVHHQWKPDNVYFDRPPDDVLMAELRRRGHVSGDRCVSGVVQAIQVTPAGLIGASDPRKEGRPNGY